MLIIRKCWWKKLTQENEELPYSQIKSLNTEELSILPKLIYSFKAISIQILAKMFVHIGKLILKFKRKDKRNRMARQFWKWKIDIKDCLNWFQNLLCSYSNQDSLVLGGTDTYSLNRVQNSETDTLEYTHLIFPKHSLNWGRTPFQQMMLVQWDLHRQKI